MKDDTTSIFAVNVPETRHHVPGIQMSGGKNYKVYREVHDIGQQPVSTRWVVSQKSQGNFKARCTRLSRGWRDVSGFTHSTGEKSSTMIIYMLAAVKVGLLICCLSCFSFFLL